LISDSFWGNQKGSWQLYQEDWLQPCCRCICANLWLAWG